jgi:Na+-translocating ferredoxin:NAD+ oxidoreductase subunit B
MTIPVQEILIAVGVLAGLGIAFGIGLAIASKRFAVQADPRQEQVTAALPGVNCGGCGKPGCAAFAEALLRGEAVPEGCVVASDEVRKAIAGILGIEASARIRNVAVLHCHGGNTVKERFSYQGLRDCTAASMVQGGPKACVFGCIGYGTCVNSCAFGALSMGLQGLPVVDEEKCTACGACVAACPKKLYELIPITKVYAVRCRSLDAGRKVMEVCPVGCIGCGKCSKACPTGTMLVVDNLAVLNYHKCDNRGECFKVCPRKTIAKKEHTRWIARQ